MEISVVISFFGLATMGVGVWVRMNTKLATVETRVIALEKDLSEHKRTTSNMYTEMNTKLDNIYKELHELGKNMASIAAKLEALEKHQA